VNKLLQLAHNKRMQSDQNARCAFILTADAGRYVSISTPVGYQDNLNEEIARS
jgi:hypothetical protein